MENINFDSKILLELTKFKMPFGKFQNRVIADLPEHYLLWFKNKGFPPGKLGILMSTMYEIQLNGLDYLIKELKNRYK